MDDLIRIENEYDRQTVAWLRERLGEQALCEVVLRMQGRGKPYASAVCRALGLVPPPRRRGSGEKHFWSVTDKGAAAAQAWIGRHQPGGRRGLPCQYPCAPGRPPRRRACGGGLIFIPLA